MRPISKWKWAVGMMPVFISTSWDADALFIPLHRSRSPTRINGSRKNKSFSDVIWITMHIILTSGNSLGKHMQRGLWCSADPVFDNSLEDRHSTEQMGKKKKKKNPDWDKRLQQLHTANTSVFSCGYAWQRFSTSQIRPKEATCNPTGHAFSSCKLLTSDVTHKKFSWIYGILLFVFLISF